MGFSSQSGQVILRSQTTTGTYQADTGTAGVAVLMRGGSLGPNRELLIPDAEIGAGRDVADAYLGAVSWSGDYELYGRVDAITTLMKAALGDPAAPVTATGLTTHTITPLDSGTLPFLSIEENVGGTLETFRYTDVAVNTLHLEADANGYLMCTAGMIAAKQTSGHTKSTPAAAQWDNTPMIVGTNVTVSYAGSTFPAKSFSLDINNNFEDDDFRLGSLYLGDLTAKRREVTASFGIRESSSALWRQAVYGLNTANEAGGITTKDQLVITCSAYENIPGATPSTKYNFVITIPKFALRPYSLDPSGDDVIENDVEGQALRPAQATKLMTYVAKTGRATIA